VREGALLNVKKTSVISSQESNTTQRGQPMLGPTSGHGCDGNRGLDRNGITLCIIMCL